MSASCRIKHPPVPAALFGVVGALVFLWWGSVASAGGAAEQLIVFTHPSASALAERFEQNTMPKLRQLAEELAVELVTVDVSQRGTPEAVSITPLIVYQNHRGRSVYQGRYETLDRVKNFVRTARFMPQGGESLEKTGLPVKRFERATLATPVKITDLVGAVPDGFDAEVFQREMLAAIASSMKGFELQERVSLGRADRMFYVDFHPYLAEDGTLYVSTELYSQFHCHEPVWSGLKEPRSGPWVERDRVFAQASSQLTEQIDRQLRESELGDGFDAVPMSVSLASWESLGLSLPAKPQGAGEVSADVALVRDWVMDTAAQRDRPAVQFSFPAPLDGYAGEVTSVSGTISLGEDTALVGSTGRFVADPATVTMGEPDLDDAIHGTMLLVDQFSEAFFELQRVEAEPGKLPFNTVTPAVLVGWFTMMGKTIELSVPASVEAVVNADGQPRLIVGAAWAISLSQPFGLEGPPGPKEASDTLCYTAHLTFKPAS